MTKAEKLLEQWLQRAPKDGVTCRDAVAVMEYLGMEVTTDGQHHKMGYHPALLNSDEFPLGFFRVNCHAFGIQGKAHPFGVKDILKAARIIRGEE